MIADHNQAHADEVARELGNERAIGIAVDVADEAQVDACFAKIVAKEGARHGCANVICPGFVRTPLVDRQIPEQARELGISEQDVIRNVMLKETVDGEFTTVEDVAQTALFLASFGSNALTGQSVVVSHGWSMQIACTVHIDFIFNSTI